MPCRASTPGSTMLNLLSYNSRSSSGNNIFYSILQYSILFYSIIYYFILFILFYYILLYSILFYSVRASTVRARPLSMSLCGVSRAIDISRMSNQLTCSNNLCNLGFCFCPPADHNLSDTLHIQRSLTFVWVSSQQAPLHAKG
jgi:hypothetical protein